MPDSTISFAPKPMQALSERVFLIQGMLTPHECQELIGLSEAAGFDKAQVRTDVGQKSMPTVRNNDRTILEHPEWVAKLWQRLPLAELPTVAGQRPAGLPRELRFYRYGSGQRFKMHKDGPWRENGLTSQLTLLVYLNEGYTGGRTDFREFQVTGRTGDCLIFIHNTWHEGEALAAGQKYVLRSDVLYQG